MSDDRPAPSSPACLAHEADDAYMGYATKDELAAFLNERDMLYVAITSLVLALLLLSFFLGKAE